MVKRNIGKIAGKIVSEKGYVSVIDLFVAIGWLDKKPLSAWKAGKVLYLESVITGNLHKLSTAMKELKSWAMHSNLKSSVTVYKYKGHLLRFSKSGHPNIETMYSTHYVLRRN